MHVELSTRNIVCVTQRLNNNCSIFLEMKRLVHRLDNWFTNVSGIFDNEFNALITGYKSKPECVAQPSILKRPSWFAVWRKKPCNTTAAARCTLVSAPCQWRKHIYRNTSWCTCLWRTSRGRLWAGIGRIVIWIIIVYYSLCTGLCMFHRISYFIFSV